MKITASYDIEKDKDISIAGLHYLIFETEDGNQFLVHFTNYGKSIGVTRFDGGQMLHNTGILVKPKHGGGVEIMAEPDERFS